MAELRPASPRPRGTTGPAPGAAAPAADRLAPSREADDRPDTERVRFARVSDMPITVDECSDAVASATSGAVVTFAGVVRDHDDGRGVVALDYEAHPSASDAIAAVASAVAAEFPAVTLAVSHRTGSLVVGDVALACAAASAHRADAFAACARLVDAVKESVPIWKHQRFADGTSEWVASLG